MSDIFALTMPIQEVLVRGTVVYFAMVVLLRAIPSRNAGHISPNDMLTLVVIGTLGTSAIIGDGNSVLDVVLMIALILLWAYVIDLLEYRVPGLRRFLRHRKTKLIDDGRMVRRNMRRELVTEEELLAALRTEGIEDIAAIRCAYMEADGEISVIAKSQSRER